MKLHAWDEEKNQHLKRTRNISFETILSQIDQGYLLDTVNNPSSKYKEQKMYVIEYNNYAYLVPFIQTKDRVFMITIIPNRQATKKYLNQGEGNG